MVLDTNQTKVVVCSFFLVILHAYVFGMQRNQPNTCALMILLVIKQKHHTTDN
jgi:hypothetical protein